MSNIVVDAEGVSNEMEAVAEPVTNEEVVAAEEALVEETQVEEPAYELPSKFAGKTIEEVAESYENLEKELGRKQSEVGELRQLSDSFLKAEISRKQPETNPQPSVEEDTDFFDDPNKAVNQAIENHPKFQQFQQFQQQQQQNAAKVQLEQTHPDYADIVKDKAFQEYVKGSPVRMQLFQAADSYNFDAANELINGYKAQGLVAKTQEVKKQQEVDRKQALKVGTTESSTTSDSVGGKDFYRRAELIRLKIDDPAKYEAHQDEIFKAYAEGRVK